MKDYLHLILGALALLLAAFLCLRGPTPAPTAAVAPPPPVIAAPAPVPVPTPVAASARLDVLAADKKVVLEGVVRDEPTKAKLVAQAASFYGAPNVTDKLTIDDKVTALKSIVLTGEVPSDQIKTGTGDSVKAAVGPEVGVDNQLRVVAPSAAAQSAQIKALLQGRHIEFITGSAQITAEGRKILSELVPVLELNKASVAEIQGHTDNVGAPASNQLLSEQRAQSTLQYLAASGVDAKRLTSKGFGDTKPISGNETVEGRQHNRRIDFQVEDK